ncbi:MAG: class F sortase [Marmoricola sp.]
MKHRGQPRRRLAVLATCSALASIAVLGVSTLWPDPSSPHETITKAAVVPVGAPLSAPTGHPRPRYLTRSYRAPASLVRQGAGGALGIPSLGIHAPVDAVGLDGTAMAVPNEPARVGWLTSTAHADDIVGSSVLAGHVSDEHDRPGALNRLGRIKVGAAIVWTGPTGKRVLFRVVRTRLYPRSRGLPATMFASAGPRELNLVTCAARVTTSNGGFHYTSNLVVTAVR